MAAWFSTHTNLIVNAVGADRPGIVSDMTKFVTDVGGNVGQSQAAKLGHYFSLMMQIEVPSQHLEKLKNSLTTMPGMNASIFETTKPDKITLTPSIACKKKNKKGTHSSISLLFDHCIVNTREHVSNTLTIYIFILFYSLVIIYHIQTLVNSNWKVPVILVLYTTSLLSWQGTVSTLIPWGPWKRLHLMVEHTYFA